MAEGSKTRLLEGTGPLGGAELAGVMTGCMCGCRGDMEVTEAGLTLLDGSE